MYKRSEDEVRDGYTSETDFIPGAKQILGFDKPEKGVEQGTGQIKTFNQLGFKGVDDKPDGWYFPKNKALPAIILETKSEHESITAQKHVDELFKNTKIAHQQYKDVIGILYNGHDVAVYQNEKLVPNCGGGVLQDKHFYINLFSNAGIDKELIYSLTKRINDNLNSNFGIKNLNHRMILTACALVARQFNVNLTKGTSYNAFKADVTAKFRAAMEDNYQQHSKLELLVEALGEIKMNYKDNQAAMDDFLDCVLNISDSINSSRWNGEDVMAIFFNEFNRYKGKATSGQVFTPDHIVSLIYRIMGCNKDSVVFDGACGSGTFLVKSMANMIREAGPGTDKAKEIMAKQLYGIEFDREIFALACANMLIHKDGKTNLRQMDTRTEAACNWIKSLPITHVLMNPPYEQTYGCMTIVENVLDNVEKGTMCAFILPDKKLEKTKSFKLLKKHSLLKIIKLPTETFDEGVSTSIFIFEAGVTQGNKEVFCCEIKEDGLVRIKNQRRQDVKNKWKEIEDYWAQVIYRQSGDDSIVWITPSANAMSYPEPEKEFEIYEENFVKTMMDYEMFKRGIHVKEFNEQLIQKVIYSSDVSHSDNVTAIFIRGDNNEQN